VPAGPEATLVVLATLLTAGTAQAATPEDEPVPLSQQETRAPKHPDCEHRVPLWHHTVVAGESLGIIAGKYGVRRHDVAALNPQLANPDHIVPGQAIRVCPEIAPRLTKTVHYVVAAGDSLTKIAERHGLTLDELVEQVRTRDPRGIPADPRKLRLGQTFELTVDGGVVEDFLPPPPRAKKHTAKSGTGAPPRSARVNVQLNPTDAIHIKRPHLAFGTKKTVGLLHSVIAQYTRRHGKGPKVVIGDMSRQGGGAIHPHVSHQRGVDVDVGYVLRGAAAERTRFAGVSTSNLDRARTWGLVKAFLDTHQVVYIFMDYAIQKELYEYARGQGVSADELDELFQYPRGRGRSHGIIRHWKSHQHHFHVRFR
jgi:LysM repeat protein